MFEHSWAQGVFRASEFASGLISNGEDRVQLRGAVCYFWWESHDQRLLLSSVFLLFLPRHLSITFSIFDSPLPITTLWKWRKHVKTPKPLPLLQQDKGTILNMGGVLGAVRGYCKPQTSALFLHHICASPQSISGERYGSGCILVSTLKASKHAFQRPVNLSTLSSHSSRLQFFCHLPLLHLIADPSQNKATCSLVTNQNSMLLTSK